AIHQFELPVTPLVAVLYQKQRAFTAFRVLVLAIVFRPAVLLWLRMSVLYADGTEWAVEGLCEASLWLIYAGLLGSLRANSVRLGLLGHVLSDVRPAGLVTPEVRPDTGFGSEAIATADPTSWQSRASTLAAAAAAIASSGVIGESAAPYVQLPGGPDG
ncbi:unnamed protein product, partial [Polarella glacialis]